MVVGLPLNYVVHVGALSLCAGNLPALPAVHHFLLCAAALQTDGPRQALLSTGCTDMVDGGLVEIEVAVHLFQGLLLQKYQLVSLVTEVAGAAL